MNSRGAVARFDSAQSRLDVARPPTLIAQLGLGLELPEHVDGELAYVI